MTHAVPELVSPHPLGRLLPALYQDDPLAQRFTAGLDDVLAPVLCVLDCLHAYVDPAVAPRDFVTWLASWLGVEPDDNVPLEQRRATVRHAADAYRWHGTARGVAAAVRSVSGRDPVVDDSGGASWSVSPAAAPPYPGPPRVDVFVPLPCPVDVRVIERAVAAAKPAHVVHRVDVGGSPR